MSNVLIRGIPARIHEQIQKMAKTQNLSVNQTFIKLVCVALEQMENKAEEEERRAQVFERIERLREEIRKKYGRFDDSTKLIREARDSR